MVSMLAIVLELALKLPVLDGLQIAQRQLCRPCQFVPVDLGDGRPGRQLRLDGDRQVDQLETVQHFLTIEIIIRFEIEVRFDVAEPEDGNRAEVGQARHAVQGRFQGDRDLPLDFLRRVPAFCHAS